MNQLPIEIPDFAAAARLWAEIGEVPALPGAPTIDGFRVIAALGTGGQATTWLAIREVDGRMLAVKVARFSSSGFPLRHWSELRVLSECRVASVARFAGSGIADGFPWLATEFVEGPTLDNWAAGRPANEVLAMLARVADVLGQLHAAGVVHRDIKPANIIVAEGGQPVLIDLGLGFFIDSPLDRTIDGLPAGSPAFMSPEQARGERSSIGPASDVWSLGATAFLLLAGELPHAAAGSVAAQVARAGTERPRRARDIAPTLPAPIAAVLDWAVEPRIEDRPASAAAFAEALRRAAEGRSVAPGGGKRGRAVVGVVAILALLAAPLPFVTTWFGDAAPEADDAEQSVGPRLEPLTREDYAMIAGDYPNAKFGNSIAVLGDLDGDGKPEVAIGAPDAPGRQPDGRYVELAGEVSVVRGADVCASVQSGAARLLAPMHRIAGADVRGHAGAVLCSAGDMDGDNIEELAILAEGPERESGTVTIVRGSEVLRTGSLARCVADRQAIRIEGVSLRKLPSGMAHCDVDGDQLEDLLIGCPGAGGVDGARAGEVMVVHGARSLFGPESRPAVVRRVAGPEGVYGFGASIASVHAARGEYVVVGAPLGERPGPGGTGCIVLARASAFAETDRLRSPMLVASHGGPDEWFGETVSAESPFTGIWPTLYITILAGGSGVANASNDGGMFEAIELRLDEDGNLLEAKSNLARRGRESPLGRGQQMGAAVAIHTYGCCSMPMAIASPRDSAMGVAAGSVLLWDSPYADPATPVDEPIYHGTERALEVGRSLAWWDDGYGHNFGNVALLIGAPGADSPAGQPATGAVWIVPYQESDHACDP